MSTYKVIPIILTKSPPPFLARVFILKKIKNIALLKFPKINYNMVYGRVAQLVRASSLYLEGPRFESWHAHQNTSLVEVPGSNPGTPTKILPWWKFFI